MKEVMIGWTSSYKGERNVYRICWRYLGKRSLRRMTCAWEENIERDLKISLRMAAAMK
jgi:hypothetical protein